MDCFASLAMTRTEPSLILSRHTPRMRVSSTPRLLDSIAGVSGILDHPHARVMTTESTVGVNASDTAPHSRRALRPSRCKILRPYRAQGMPGARCTRGLVCKIVRRTAHEHTGSAETLRHSPRNGFTAYAVISSATNSSCHRRCRLDGSSIRLDRSSHRQLDTSNGCRDHTVLPYASAPFVLRAG